MCWFIGGSWVPPSFEQWPKPCLLVLYMIIIPDYTTQSYTVEIIKRNYKDSYEPTTTMECHRDFERCACWSSSVLCFLRNSSISITLYDLLVPVRWSRLIQSFQVTWTNDREYYNIKIYIYTYLLSETNTVPKIGYLEDWKTSFLLGSLFSGDMLRSFREGIRIAELVN